MLNRMSVLVLAIMVICACGQPAGAAGVGPVDPITKFPLYYLDDKGVIVAGPPPVGDNSKAPTNIFDPVIPGHPLSIPTGFGLKYYYWRAEVDPDFRTPAGKVAITFGLEATYAGGTLAAGRQTVFSRIHLRAVLPAAGTYTFDHPYGTDTFTVTPDEVSLKGPINIIRDVGLAAGDFNAVIAQGGDVLKGFLAANTIIAADPDEWLGDGVTLATVTGGPARNFVRLTGPPGAGLNPPTGANFIRTNLFIVSGHLWHHYRRYHNHGRF